MITIESMVSRLERGDDKKQAAIFAYASTAYPRLTGLSHHRGLRDRGLRP